MSTAPNPAPNYKPRRHRSIFGPLMMIIIGVCFLAANFGWISGRALAEAFTRYWPALLILWGVVKIGEYFLARQKGEPAHGIGPGGVVFLIFFILFGLTASGAHHAWDSIRNNPDFEMDNDWFPFHNSYEFSENLAQPVTDASQMRVVLNAGDVNITASPDNQTHLYVRKSLQADSQDAANHLNGSTHPRFQMQGSVWVLDLTGGDFQHGRFNVDLQVPPKLPLTVNTRHGNVTVDGQAANLELTSEHGELNAKNITGNVVLLPHHGDVSVDGVTGNVDIHRLGGLVNHGDMTVNGITGSLNIECECYGDSRFSRISGPVHFKSNRTDMQMGRLDGELNLDSGDLRANNLAGPFKLITRSKTVNLEGISGDIHIEDSNASIGVAAKSPLGAVDISNKHGGIEIAVPASAGFQADAESTNGDITSDFELAVDNSHRDATAHGTVNKGGPMMHLRADRGTIQIKKQ